MRRDDKMGGSKVAELQSSGMGEGLGDASGEGVGEGLGDASGEEIGDRLGDASGEGVGDGLGDASGEGIGEGLGDASGEGLGEGNICTGTCSDFMVWSATRSWCNHQSVHATAADLMWQAASQTCGGGQLDCKLIRSFACQGAPS